MILINHDLNALNETTETTCNSQSQNKITAATATATISNTLAMRSALSIGRHRRHHMENLKHKKMILSGQQTLTLLMVLLIACVCITPSIASNTKHSASTKAKKAVSDAGGIVDSNSRHSARSVHQQQQQQQPQLLSSTATSISSPNYLYSPKSHLLKSSSSVTRSVSLPVTSSDILAQYTLPNGSYFTHMTFDRRHSVWYAGASNRILQLNYNLSVLSQAVTGPKMDNPQCHGVCPENTDTMETNNHNKILIVNEAGGTLITCGSVMQGSCYIYPTDKFPNSPQFIDIPLAANDETASTLAFIGPSRYTTWTKKDVLYVGATFTNVGDYRHEVPAISSRNLDDLHFAEYSFQQTILNIDVNHRDHFLVDYKYGFNTTDYAYFVIVQKKSHLAEEAGFITRIARVCVSDPNYDTYTEITLQCKKRLSTNENDVDATEINYNILRDAKVTPAGQRLAQQMGIKRDDLVLIAAFSPSKEITNEPQPKSAVCLYSLKDIDETFTENIHKCFNGSIKDRNMGYISGTINEGKCPGVGTTGNVHNFCNVGLKISGVSPIIAYSLFDFENESITSVTAALTGPHTLAFLGTANGWIKKVLISGTDPGEYESVEIDPGNAIIPDTMMSPKQDYLYVLSKQKITKLRVEHCSIYTNCSSCLESRDPFCGWCSLEKRCTIRNACHKDASNQRWLSLGTGHQCIDFEMVLPNQIPINQMTSVQLVIRILPELPANAKYRCVFGNSTPIDATVLENGLSCQTPPVNSRPTIPAQSDHVSVPLSVRSSETNKDFVSRSFSFFDCSRHDTCRKCVQSEWNCNWCLYDNRCVHNSTTCRNTASVISQAATCPHYKPNANNEPILLANQVPKEIRLEIENLPRPQSAHTGFSCIANIEGAHMILPARVESKKFIVCEKTTYSYEAATNEYEARVDILWNRNHYIDTVPIILYKCDVLGSHREHADCSLCVTRPSKYQCTWCGNTCMYNETCSTGMAVNECPRPRIDMIKPLSGPMEGGTLITIEGSNLGIRAEDVRDNIRIGDIPCELVNYDISVKIECRTGPSGYEMSAPIRVGNAAGYTESAVKFSYKDIQLDGLLPQRGPQSGGTKLSIIGKWLNIGSSITAFLDNYECAVNGSQASSSQITCTTSAARHPQEIRELTLIIDGANRTYTCRNAPPTAPSDTDTDLDLKSYNRYSDLIGCSIFNYTTDPKVMQIKPLKSFSSGGRMITVHGTNLDSIQKPELEVFLQDEFVNKTVCTVITPNQMECPSPPVNAKFNAYRREIELMQQQMDVAMPTASLDKPNGSLSERRKRQNTYAETLYTTIGYYTSAAASTPWSTPILTSSIYVDGIGATSPTALASTSSEIDNDLSTSNDIAASLKVHETQLSLQVSFIMDNVQSVRDLDKHFHNLRSTIIYVDDPVYFSFPNNNVKLYKGDTLVIEGEKLNIASDESDVSVTIGQKQCNVTSLALTQLVCTPPDQQPDPTDELGIETSTYLPLVVVHVGKTLRFPIGYLKYELLKPYTFSHAIVGIAIGCAIIVCLLFVILIVYRRKSTQAEREYKRIQIQMDTLESNVRMECKQAFAELQTDIGLTADLENSGIPTLDHISYIMKVFFPGVSDHPILNSPKLRIQTSRTNYDTAMIQFEQLINNKVFLLTFIDTLEAQKSFNIRDKVNVASLLMIVLMNKMDYATDILKCLLLRLIDKSVMTKHPQLMLRRTESVVEKMLTNYMAICMYDYLKEFAGSSLFLLFKAIKHQIEKGAVDAVTHEARYSLSEEKLLREQIAHNPVTLHIVQEDLDEKIQCKVLDCDTISQVKSKILDQLFKNTPFSMRPSIHEVDLEWRHGRGGHLTLQDEDLTTKTVGQWKRLNTLSHYGVKESAVMSLIVRQTNTEMYNNSYNAKQHQPNHGYYMNNSQSHIIMNNDLDGLQSPAVSGVRYFHLVKPIMFSANLDDHHLNIKNMAMSIGVLGSQGMQILGSGGVVGDRNVNKTIPEIFLTRLLATKGTIQKFVDDFFHTILTVNEDLPPAVKWLFDLLDEAAHRHGIVDMDIIHAWKSNSLPLRFWVNFIKNPDFIFDINKTTTVDACLSVIAQTFMDSCSTTEHRLGKDSPSNKLLFAKDIPQYREMVKQFYRDVAQLPQISDHAISSIMEQLSINDEFDTIAALKELYIYVTKYRDQILDALNNDASCMKSHLAHKLENVACTLEGEETSAC